MSILRLAIAPLRTSSRLPSEFVLVFLQSIHQWFSEVLKWLPLMRRLLRSSKLHPSKLFPVNGSNPEFANREAEFQSSVSLHHY